MENKKSIWTSLTGGLSSAAPVLLSCCKSGACIGVCASPVASLFGISTASLAGSPLLAALEPLLIAVSAVAFTVSYYSLYVLPKKNCNTSDCGCVTPAQQKRDKLNKAVFWAGLVISIGFLSFFEITKYQQAVQVQQAGTAAGCTAPSEACCPAGEESAANGAATDGECAADSSCCEPSQDLN